MNSEFVDLGLFLLLPAAVNKTSFALRETFKAFSTEKYSLESVPHISIFQGRFPQTVHTKLEAILAELAPKVNFTIQFTTPLYVHNSDNLFWNANCCSHFRSLQARASELLFPLTEGMLLEQFAALQAAENADARELELIKQHGFSLAEERYMPHVTICNLKDNADYTEMLHNMVETECSASALAFGIISPAGAIEKVVATISF